MIEAEQVQHGGMEVVDAHFVHDGLLPDLVGLAVVHAAFHAAAGQPRGEQTLLYFVFLPCSVLYLISLTLYLKINLTLYLKILL